MGKSMSNNNNINDYNDRGGEESSNIKSKPKSTSKTPILDDYSRDLTKLAEQDMLDPIVGRSKEIDRVSQILSRRKKNNPILIGEPGVGKSAIAEGLASRIISRSVSRVLFDKRVIMLDLTAMLAGTKYRGEFEERVKLLLNEIESEKNIILFIDEIHTIIGAGGSSGSLDVSNMLKPALARGEVQVIGATTLEEYRKHIEKDGALERRFQKIIIEPTNQEETIEILNNIKEKYEYHHNVKYTDEAIKACVDLTNRYMTDRFFPDKAIDAMDEVGSSVHINNIKVPEDILNVEEKLSDIRLQKDTVIKAQKYEEAAKLRDVERQLIDNLKLKKEVWEENIKNNKEIVHFEDVARVVSLMTGIPINKIDNDDNVKLANMFDVISKNIIGQDDAIRKVVKAIQRGRVGMKDPNKPIFSGILIGNSGVGKTELAKQIAINMFGSEDSLIRLDMSEYMEKISLTRIQGAAPGYVGYDDSNVLDKIKRKPYSVVLFDEIEKAHPDVFNLFLQMLDEGQITDSHGRKVSFKNTVILMTSNVGTKVVKEFGDGPGFNTKSKIESSFSNTKITLEKELKKKFSPEFINRLDDIIYFKDLDKEDILKIVDIELNKTIRRAENIGFNIKVDDKLKMHLCEVGYDKEYGARPLKRAIQKWIDDYVTEFIIDNSIKEGNLYIDYDNINDRSIVTKV